MAVNPLAIYIGLSVATLGGIVVVQQQKFADKHSSNTQQAIVAKNLATPPAAPRVGVPTMPEKAVKKPTTPAPKTQPQQAAQKVASLPPKTTPPAAKAKRPAVKTTTAPAKTPQKQKPVKLTGPQFDMVRVDREGGAVIAGRATPGAEVILRLDNKTIGKTKANKSGDWVFIPDQLIPSGSHQMVVVAKQKNKKPQQSRQTVIIAMAKDKISKPLIAISKQDAPTKVVQKPSPPKQAAKTKIAAAKKKPAPEKVAKAPDTIIKEKTKEVSKEVARPNKTVQKTAPAPMLEKTASKVAEKPDALPAPKAKSAQPVPQTKPKSDTLVFGTVDYDDSGAIVFSGTASVGKTVRIYVNNKFVGEGVAGKNGKWVFNGKENIAPGTHELRADLISRGGQVSKRVAVPFVRAKPKQVASLLKSRSVKSTSTAKRAAEKPVAKETAAKKPDLNKPAAKLKVAAVETSRAAEQKPKAATTNKANTKPAETKPGDAEPVALKKVEPKQVEAKQAKIGQAKNEPGKKTSGQQTELASTPVQPAGNEKPEPAEKPKLVSHVVIQPGNNLWNISRVIYGKGVAYTTIYQANKSQIKNPDRIYPGQIFDTPGAQSSGSINPDVTTQENRNAETVAN